MIHRKATISAHMTVPEKLRKNGFDYTLYRRGGRSLIFEQHVDSELSYYEVFQIKIQPAGEMFGKHYPDREKFPGNEDFGVWAWSYQHLDAALVKFEELENSQP